MVTKFSLPASTVASVSEGTPFGGITLTALLPAGGPEGGRGSISTGFGGTATGGGSGIGSGAGGGSGLADAPEAASSAADFASTRPLTGPLLPCNDPGRFGAVGFGNVPCWWSNT